MGVTLAALRAGESGGGDRYPGADHEGDDHGAGGEDDAAGRDGDAEGAEEGLEPGGHRHPQREAYR